MAGPRFRRIALGVLLLVPLHATSARAQDSVADVLSFLLTTQSIPTGDFVKDAQSAEVTREGKCVVLPGELVSLGNIRDLPTTVEHRMLTGAGGKKIGYIAFNYWMLPMIERVKAAMTDLRGQGMEALVLDLRGNPGGVGAMSIPVARLLLRESGSLGKLQFRDFAQEFNVAGDPDAFAGPVVILVDEGTASTSEIFAAGLRDLGRKVVELVLARVGNHERFDAREKGGNPVVILLRPLVKRMIVALGAGDAHTQEKLSGGFGGLLRIKIGAVVIGGGVFISAAACGQQFVNKLIQRPVIADLLANPLVKVLDALGIDGFLFIPQ